MIIIAVRVYIVYTITQYEFISQQMLQNTSTHFICMSVGSFNNTNITYIQLVI